MAVVETSGKPDMSGDEKPLGGIERNEYSNVKSLFFNQFKLSGNKTTSVF